MTLTYGELGSLMCNWLAVVGKCGQSKGTICSSRDPYWALRNENLHLDSIDHSSWLLDLEIWWFGMVNDNRYRNFCMMQIFIYFIRVLYVKIINTKFNFYDIKTMHEPWPHYMLWIASLCSYQCFAKSSSGLPRDLSVSVLWSQYKLKKLTKLEKDHHAVPSWR